MTRFLLLLLAFGCASQKTDTKKYFISTKDFASPEEASAYLTNQRRFFLLTFEQSHDPYYGTPRWSAQCLKENAIGEIRHSHGHEIFASHLYYRGSVGHCSSDPMASLIWLVLVKCAGQRQVKTIQCAEQACSDSEAWESVCE